MIIVPIITHPNVESCYILGALLVGIIVYVVFIYHKFTFPMIGKTYYRIQMHVLFNRSVRFFHFQLL